MTQRLFIVCVSGTREKLQMAAMIASVAAAGGDEVSVFFSMNALGHFIEGSDPHVPTEGEFGDLMARTSGVPPFKQLFEFAVELGSAKLLPCSMALDLLQVGADQLDPVMGPATGLTGFLSEAAGGQLLTF